MDRSSRQSKGCVDTEEEHGNKYERERERERSVVRCNELKNHRDKVQV
jgi:hypothetical protein